MKIMLNFKVNRYNNNNNNNNKLFNNNCEWVVMIKMIDSVFSW